MSAFIVSARNNLVRKGKESLRGLYEEGIVISKHRDTHAANKRIQELEKGLDELGKKFYIYNGDVDIEVGTKRLDILELCRKEERDQNCLRMMKAILRPNEHYFHSSLIAETLVEYGLTVDSLKEQYLERAESELAEQAAAELRIAEFNARKKAIQADVEDAMNGAFGFQFPAAAGIQNKKQFFTAMIPYRALVRLFVFDDELLPPECRAQRELNSKRAEKIADYISENPDSYVLPALTASVSREMTFTPVNDSSDLGTLNIPFDAVLLINDGQHRRAGIELAIKARPELAKECVPVTIFFDEGLKRSQQIFADINTSMSKPSTSLSALYDSRSGLNRYLSQLMTDIPCLGRIIDLERNSVPKSSDKLFTLVAVKKFVTVFTGKTQRYFDTAPDEELTAWTAEIRRYLSALDRHLPDWNELITGQISAISARDSLVSAHGVFFEALAFLGRSLAGDYSDQKLGGLAEISLNKKHPAWANRCIVSGRLNKSATGVKSTAAVLIKAVGLELPADLQEVENRIERSNSQ